MSPSLIVYMQRTQVNINSQALNFFQ